MRDLRGLLWSSIDNDTSRDLDQIEVAERLANGDIRIRVGIADVDGDVPKGSPIDAHAAANCTTVYTGVKNFPDAARRSVDGSDVAERACRPALGGGGDDRGRGWFRAGWHGLSGGHAQRRAVGLQLGRSVAGRAGRGAARKWPASQDLQAQLRLQDEAAQKLREQRSPPGRARSGPRGDRSRPVGWRT